MSRHRLHIHGIPAAVTSAILLGLSPILGKLAITSGVPPLGVVALRTTGAVLLLTLVLALTSPGRFAIYPLGLIGCTLAGALNGVGSLFYYSGLGLVDASLGHLLFSLYPLHVAILLVIDGYRFTWVTALRLTLSLPAIFLLSMPGSGQTDPRGVIMMLVAGILFAAHIPINQRVLYEVPAPTVTLYTLAAMTLVVVPVAFFAAPPLATWDPAGLPPVVGLTLVTFAARLALFLGVKSIGGMDTALIGLGELVITLLLASIWLGETLTPSQWLGAGFLLTSILLIGFDRRRREPPAAAGWLRWLLPPVPYGHPSSGSAEEPSEE